MLEAGCEGWDDPSLGPTLRSTTVLLPPSTLEELHLH